MLRQNAININFFQRLADIFLNLVGFLAAYYFRKVFAAFIPGLDHIPYPFYYYHIFILSSLFILLLGNTRKIYHSQRLSKITEEIREVIIVFATAFILSFSIFTLFYQWAPSRSFIVINAVFSTGLAVLLRIVVRYGLGLIRSKGLNVKNIIIVGTGKEAEDFTEQINKNREWGIKIIGYVMVHPQAPINPKINKKYVLGTTIKLRHLISTTTVDEVIFAVDYKDFGRSMDLLLLCEKMGLNTKVKMNVFSLEKARPTLDYLGNVPYITFTSQPEPSLALLIKNIFDFVFALAGLVVLIPLVFIPVAVIIKLTTKGPVFFRQERVGEGNRSFKIIKFRTMVTDAEKLKAKLLAKNELGRKSIAFKMKNDPRVTKFGKFLRRTSIDELPQLFNVILGDMSIVGPRPPLPSEVGQYPPEYWRRIRMKPGITCIWQISGRNEVSFQEWMKMDMEYIDKWSLWLDLIIFIKTIPVVLFRKGAY